MLGFCAVQAGNVAAAEEVSQSAAGPGAVLPTLSLLRVVDLVDALWEHMPQVGGVVGAGFCTAFAPAQQQQLQ
jgi:hypothetical protein